MNRIIAYENSYINIDDDNQDLLRDLISIGDQLKSELGLRSAPVQHSSSGVFYIGNIIGNVAVNTTNLIINPKYVSSYTSGQESLELADKLFSRTIKCAITNLSSTVFFYRNNMIEDQNEFFDALAKHYSNVTRQAVRQSKICLYEDRIEKVRTIKGRILVQRQLSQPIMDVKTWCKYKQLNNNNIYNQLLFWCCKYLIGLISNLDIKQRLIALSREFPQSTYLLNRHEVSSLKPLRQFREYEESLKLAKSLYLENTTRKEKISKDNKICGYAINMEQSFENIVEYYSRIAANKMGCLHKPQVTKRLAICQVEGESGFDVRPDNLITKGQSTLIMDAKYKTLSMYEKGKSKPSSEDFYQMISSCLAYGCHEAVLVYPKGNNFPVLQWNTNNKVNDYQYTIRSEAIDLDVEDEILIKQFEGIVKNTLFYKEAFGV